jgi:hypothetical protein
MLLPPTTSEQHPTNEYQYISQELHASMKNTGANIAERGNVWKKNWGREISFFLYLLWR